MPGVVLLLPCLNEEEALHVLLGRLDTVSGQLRPEWQLSVLVVDDGSSDRTAEIAETWPGPVSVSVVRHPVNQGLGAALQTGVDWFLKQEVDQEILAVMDADATHPPELLAEMLDVLGGSRGEGPVDVVIASRYAPGGEEHGLSLGRRVYSKLASTAMRILGRVRGARDYSCGYRLYCRGILKDATAKYADGLITERAFTCMAELLIKLGRCGARVAEVPLKLHYEEKAGVSKMNVPVTIRRYLVLAWQVTFNRRWR